jgi:glycosyltransferase involved in cell wall biosynthesis
MKKICFATPGVVAMLHQGGGAVYGGSELRALRFAKGLARRGFDVSMVAPASTSVSTLRDSGIALVRDESSRVPAALRWLISRPVSLSSAWEVANADLYISFGASDYSADLADWCRNAGRRMLLCVGSDVDFSEEFRPGNKDRNHWGNRCDRSYDSMTRATAVTVQTETQRQLLRERYRRDGRVIRNPAPFAPRPEPVSGGKHLLWVGKAVANKKPHLAIELARRCPDIRLRMIANKIGKDDYGALLADRPPNVEFVENVPHGEMAREYENSFGFLSTSVVEGFPNTFIEAGAFGLPIFSLYVDPDGIIERENAGVSAKGDIEFLASELTRFRSDAAAAQAAGACMLDYVKRMHDPEARIAEFVELATEIIESKFCTDVAGPAEKITETR